MKQALCHVQGNAVQRVSEMYAQQKPIGVIAGTTTSCRSLWHNSRNHKTDTVPSTRQRSARAPEYIRSIVRAKCA